MRVVVFAYQEIGHACLDELIRLDVDVAGVFTHEDDPGENVWFPSVRDLALSQGLPVFTPRKINAPVWVQRVREWGADILFSFYYRRLLSAEMLSCVKTAALNMHGSRLPRYRGRAPVNWAIIQGETETGVTLHHMTSRPDAGDIVAQRSVPIGPDDTVLAVYRRLSLAARSLLRETLPQLAAGTAPRLPQREDLSSRCCRRTPEDGAIVWSWPAGRIHDLVRGVTHPYPGAFGRLEGRRLYVWETLKGHPAGGDGPPGLVVGRRKETGAALIQTGGGLLELRRVQAEGDDEKPGLCLPVGAVLQPGKVKAVAGG
ncbi:MAG: formyltransferase, partial [Acidobacteriota bacterium]